MATLFDILAQAQSGDGIHQIARQFGLSDAQARAAVEALTPAFSQGLKRNAADPYGVGNFLQALSTGQHARYFEDAANAFSPQATSEGNGILGHLFGSKDVSRAVAAQAAQATGLSEQIIKQMLPVLASMIMGGLFKQTTGQTGGQSGSAGNNPLGQIMEQMMRGGFGGAAGNASAPQPQVPQPGANPFDNPFGKMLQDMFKGDGAGQAGGQTQPSPFDNPLGRIFEEFTGTARQEGQPPRQPRQQPDEPQARTNPSGRQRTPYDDLFGDMFEAGSKTRDDYTKQTEAIFDHFLQGMDKRAGGR